MSDTTIAKAILIGNLGDNPDCGKTTGGEDYANLSISHNKHWTDKASRDPMQKTVWTDVAFYGADARKAQAHLKKGNKVYVEGELDVDHVALEGGGKRKITSVRGNLLKFL